MWHYEQKTGKISQDGKLVDIGYAGSGVGKNSPAMQCLKNIGPIPCGDYTIGEPKEGTHMGPFALELIPADTNEMWGRSGFFWHGDNGKGTASNGCICSGRRSREAAYASDDRKLEVISGEVSA